MAKGEIIIDEKICKGCGLCAVFCSLGCIEMSPERLSSSGLPLPSFVQPEKCTGCGVCGWMCPDFAIEVYKYVPAGFPSPRPAHIGD